MNDEWLGKELKGEVALYNAVCQHSGEEAGEKHKPQISNNIIDIRNKDLPGSRPRAFLLDLRCSSNFVFQREVALLIVLPFLFAC
jgi:hypothetical protein